MVRERKEALKCAKTAGTLAARRVRREHRFIDMLEGFISDCALAGVESGPDAFAVIHGDYRTCVSDFERAMKAASAKIDAAFAFVDNVFPEGRESLVFVTELTARKATSQFINHFGNESYYAHNESMQTDQHARELQQRAAQLNIDANRLEGAANKRPAVRERSETTSVSAGEPAPQAAQTESTCEKTTQPACDSADLAEYYSGAQFEYGFASLCKMTLPDNLVGKRVLDIGCRRGKGVFKLSSRVGESGSVIGVEWAQEHLEEARQRSERAWHDTGLPESNMTFLHGYPEDLLGAGVEENSCDVVFVNSVVNLALDPKRAFQQMFQVMKPGGLLICETVVADAPRDEDVVLRARELGNSIQAAPFKLQFEAMLAEIGYARPEYNDAHDVLPQQGYKSNYAVETAESAEDVRFIATVVHLRKPRA